MAISPQEKALACEAINRVPGLSPLARRVGLELINRADRNTGRCKPSERRLAISLGCDERSVRRAKVELQRAGFLVWLNPGHHKRCWYQVRWSRLVEAAQTLKRKIRQAATSAIAVARNRRSVQLRRFLKRLEKATLPVKSDRTKMSGNLTTQINQSFGSVVKPVQSPQKLGAILQEKAERRFWHDVMALPAALAEQVTGNLCEAVLEKALEAEIHVNGLGIKTAIELVRSREYAA